VTQKHRRMGVAFAKVDGNQIIALKNGFAI
jgi:hypothetical protein